jgi:hypothetical protein
MACPQPDKLIVSSPEELIGGHHYRLDPLLGEARKGGIDIRLAARILYYQPQPKRERRGLRVLGLDSEVGFAVLIRKPMTVALGTSSRSNSNRFAARVVTRKDTPVILPPGRLRLETRPSSTGSAPVANTIGMLAVAALAATASAGPNVRMTATESATSAAANAGSPPRGRASQLSNSARLR